jgi:DNA repair protein RadC
MLDKNPRQESVLRITDFLSFKTALSLVDVRVLDHLVVAGAEVCSFDERGLL